MNTDVLSLPWQIQLSLASGYAAYSISYIGIRSHHTTTDTLFRSLLFSVITTLILNYAPIQQPLGLSAGAVVITLLAGVVWRYGIRGVFRKIVHTTDLSWTDDVPTAWKTITAENSTHRVSQVAVELDDGTWLISSNLRQFENSPFAPCTFGLDGDVAFYVDTEIDPDGSETKNSRVCDSEFGDRMTYVPSSSIKRLSIRFLGAANRDEQVEV